jgi:hypothetical protein
METILFFEDKTGSESAYQALIDETESFGLSAEGRISFIATEMDRGADPMRKGLVVGFSRSDDAEAVVERWRKKGLLSGTVSVRWLRVAPRRIATSIAAIFP